MIMDANIFFFIFIYLFFNDSLYAKVISLNVLVR